MSGLLSQQIIEYRLRVYPVKQGLLTSQLASKSMVLFPPGEPNIIIKCLSSDAQILLVTLAQIQALQIHPNLPNPSTDY